MKAVTESKFVLFPLGRKRFALPAHQVTELAQPDELQSFPHSTPLITGVLARRGRIVPVLDIAQVLIGPTAPARKFYLIANREIAGTQEWTAVPVSGECELKTMEMISAGVSFPRYVMGILTLQDETVEVVDLDKLSTEEVA